MGGRFVYMFVHEKNIVPSRGLKYLPRVFISWLLPFALDCFAFASSLFVAMINFRYGCMQMFYTETPLLFAERYVYYRGKLLAVVVSVMFASAYYFALAPRCCEDEFSIHNICETLHHPDVPMTKTA